MKPKPHKTILLMMLSLMLLSRNTFAGPTILGVTGSTRHGRAVAISGTEFKAHPGMDTLAWLGDYIEEQSDGDTADNWPSGWGRLNNSWPDVYIDSLQAHSGAQSLRQSRPADKSYPEPYSYHFTEGQLVVYVTFWVRCERVQGIGQWTLFRLSPDEDFRDSQDASDAGELIFTKIQGSHYLTMFCENNNPSNDTCYPDDNWREHGRIGDDVQYPEDEWFRIEAYLKHNSAPRSGRRARISATVQTWQAHGRNGLFEKLGNPGQWGGNDH